jgi:outer membrane protein OmpA-like peptidoglycan-associated protein
MKRDAMRRGWPVFVVVCSIALAGCAGTSNPDARKVSSAFDYLDSQKVELQSCLGRFDGTQIERRESSIRITIGCDSLFESNSDRITPVNSTEINSVADVVKKYPETKVRVDVHTDCVRSEEENLALSELQAWIIKKTLVDQGVASSRVTARGWGESKPVVSNATEAGRKANRRVTITLEQNRS